MHNRVRMGVASFLIKDLHLPWQWGARYFLDHLVDGDYASNNHGWQWVAGSGPQASPYFRIFNPITQGEKFDPQGRLRPQIRAGATRDRPARRCIGPGNWTTPRTGTRSPSLTTPPSGRRRCGGGSLSHQELGAGDRFGVRSLPDANPRRRSSIFTWFEPAQPDAGVERIDGAGHRFDRDRLTLVGLTRSIGLVSRDALTGSRKPLGNILA